MELFLVRHGESLSNIDKSIHLTTADHAIPLTFDGLLQASAAALTFYNHMVNELKWYKSKPKIGLWMSPYLRTKQTAQHFENLNWPNNVGGESFKAKEKMFCQVREDPALAEQQFGLFDGLSDDELKFKYPEEFRHYKKCEDFGGRFWARMPAGESRFDVTLRVHQLFGSWIRDCQKHGINKIVVISHGVTIRAIVMRWMHYPVEWFEKASNPKNCAIWHIKDNQDLGYLQ